MNKIPMKKICVICEICVTKKTSQEKSVYICEICGTFSTLRGYMQRPYRSHPRKSVSNRLSSQPPNKFRGIRWIKKSHEKKSASSAKSAWLKKTSQEKSVYICEICGTFSNLRGYLQRPDRSHPRKSVNNRRSRKFPNKFREIRWKKIPWEKNLRHLRNLRDKKTDLHRWFSPILYFLFGHFII